MPGIVDADCHVIESEAIWEFIDEKMAHRRPTLVQFEDPINGRVANHWVIGGKLVPRPTGPGSAIVACPPVTEQEALEDDWACRSLAEPGMRLVHASRMGVETQIIYPTIFIAYMTGDVELEVALYRAYNRFMANVWSQGEGRLRWVAAPPLRSIDTTIEEMNFAKEHGAVGVLFRGMEEDRSIADPYFYPVYEEASRLNLPVCVHTGSGCGAFLDICDSRYTANFAHNRILPVIGFHDLVHAKVPERFPDLRFGFIEASASWVPFLLHYLNRSEGRFDKTWGDRLGLRLCKEYRFFVACEADEDIPYLLEHIGEDNLIIGSDYGHHDQSREPDMVGVMRSRGDLAPGMADKIMCENPRNLYPL